MRSGQRKKLGIALGGLFLSEKSIRRRQIYLARAKIPSDQFFSADGAPDRKRFATFQAGVKLRSVAPAGFNGNKSAKVRLDEPRVGKQPVGGFHGDIVGRRVSRKRRIKRSKMFGFV